MNWIVFIFLLIAAVASTGAAVVYFGFQRWDSNQFTLSTAATRFGLALILDYVSYVVLGRIFEWPVINGTYIAAIIYGILAVTEVFCVITYARYTLDDRRRQREQANRTN